MTNGTKQVSAVRQTPRDEVILGDCRVYLPRFRSASVDLVVTDPPYGLKSDATIARSNGCKFGEARDIRSSFSWDTRADLSWVSECMRVLKPGGTLIAFYEREHLQDVIAEARGHEGSLRDIGAWHKTNPVPQVRKVHNVIVASICQGRERTPHPTQKPLSVIVPMIRYWSNPHDLVLDPFAGSGTTAIAAKGLGRRYLAIEKDEAFHAMCLDRLVKTRRGSLDVSFANEVAS